MDQHSAKLEFCTQCFHLGKGRALLGKKGPSWLASSVTAAHPMALALDLGTSNVRRAATGSTPPNTGITGFLKLFHFFPLQAELVATAHIVPTGQCIYKTSRCCENDTLPFHKYELVF